MGPPFYNPSDMDSSGRGSVFLLTTQLASHFYSLSAASSRRRTSSVLHSAPPVPTAPQLRRRLYAALLAPELQQQRDDRERASGNGREQLQAHIFALRSEGRSITQ